MKATGGVRSLTNKRKICQGPEREGKAWQGYSIWSESVFLEVKDTSWQDDFLEFRTYRSEARICPNQRKHNVSGRRAFVTASL